MTNYNDGGVRWTLGCLQSSGGGGGVPVFTVKTLEVLVLTLSRGVGGCVERLNAAGKRHPYVCVL